MRMRNRYLGSLVLAVGLLAAGCGQEIKKENEQLKGQVANLQKENADLKAEAATLKGENEAMTKALDEMKAQMEEMQQKMKGAKTGRPAKKG
jgi:predicted nuclease with TOPRIM domain